MISEIRLPELGENITTATVVELLVAAGERIDEGQGLLALESDKAEFELPSPVAGNVTEILVSKGDEIAVGQVVARIETQAGAGGDAAATPAQADAAEASSAAAPGDAASDTVAPEATTSAEGAQIEVGAAPAEDAEAGTAEPAPAATARGTAGAGETDAPGGDGNESAPVGPRPTAAAPPSVRRLARELGIDIHEVPAAHPSGRINAEDVYRYVRRLVAAGKSGAPPRPSHRGPVEVEPMSKVRRRTAERMSLAWSSIPHVSHHDAADVTELDRLRRQFAPRVEAEGGKLTVTAVLLKVLGSALQRFPKFNAVVDMDAGAIVYKKEVHIGVAVDTERGLLVPVVRNADAKNIVELACELRDLSEAARTRRLTPDRLQGSTFTVTNLGGIGGRHFDPLINPPEVAVLGVSRSRIEPAWNGKEFEPRLTLPLTLSYDHRIIDGADAARFLRWVCEALEEPFLMDLEGN